MPCKIKRRFIAYALFSCMLFMSSCTDDVKLTDTSSADTTQEWVQSLKGKTSAEQSRIAYTIWVDTSKPEDLRNRATFILASRYNSQTSAALSSLASQYATGSLAQKIYMEETLDYDLKGASVDDLTKILRLIPPSLEAQFPYVLVIYIAAKRSLLQNSQSIMSTLSSHKYFKSAKVIGTGPLAPTEKMGSGSIALLLPQSGNFAFISQKIIAGAESARLHLQEMGSSWQVYYIDTQNPEWVQQVKALPADCVTIGGALQFVDYDILKANGILQNRAVFAFLQRLPSPEDEGQLAWQFFTKPEDQINAVLNISSEKLGIYSFGVFTPQSPYGASMGKLFTDMATSRGLSVQSADYPVDDLKKWTKNAKIFLDSRPASRANWRKVRAGLPDVHAPFDAIFFPDSWRNIDFLISTMHYHGAQTKVMLGNLLWEQSLNHPQNFNPKTFALTLFPVAYEPTQETPINTKFKDSLAKASISPNDWSALGFDFMLMSSQLNLTKKLEAPEINARLNALQIKYVGAPFYWTPQGIAHRMLFIDQPARSGRIPLNLEHFMRYKSRGGAIPNRGESMLTEEVLKKQEKRALEEVDTLIENIMSRPIDNDK